MRGLLSVIVVVAGIYGFSFLSAQESAEVLEKVYENKNASFQEISLALAESSASRVKW